jgi:aspartyl-tRNA(Asn)/glutamyl-tRNA(Gln) amidotransferase subunit C
MFTRRLVRAPPLRAGLNGRCSRLPRPSVERGEEEGGETRALVARTGTICDMPIDIDIARVAGLARIALTDDELAEYAAQLENILDHAERVQALPTEGVEPTSHPLPMVNAFRPDVVTGSLCRDEALAGAPEVEDGYFRVPRILDEP